MGHHNPNKHYLPVNQVSNADLLRAAQDTGHLAVISVPLPNYREEPPMGDSSLATVTLGEWVDANVPNEGDVATVAGFTVENRGAFEFEVTDPETAEILADPEALAAIVEGLGEAFDASMERLHSVDPASAPPLTPDEFAINLADLRSYYDSFLIGALRKIASKAGFVGAYRGPKKNDLVDFCITASIQNGERV